MKNIEEHYFKSDKEWRTWLHENHNTSKGVYLIFYKVAHENDSMRWEEAVKVALCYGWIDSTVKSLGNGKRRQYFTPRNPKSVWSALNKNYIEVLIAENLMHESGIKTIEIAKQNGSWTALDDVENGVIPDDLQLEFDNNNVAFQNYQNFAPSYRKSYLYWLNQAKRETTRQKRINEIIELCANNIKSKGDW
ncbi:YdeI/OmpD-associated family protein [Sabulilitoribacter multivorans]|uniref:YdeI/OmpD-associated family protein n=1 Tax=Flaviramulus multivorans TaxID=1304750 RepID=A0ABS9IL79_9FLAO|nr:YdeI/OmpD-associated family protein [Flaviramulus multivorans]MCF7561345.1 YdeI/OmpD-associated family protein [Flaviramulus multivorans]